MPVFGLPGNVTDAFAIAFWCPLCDDIGPAKRIKVADPAADQTLENEDIPLLFQTFVIRKIRCIDPTAFVIRYEDRSTVHTIFNLTLPEWIALCFTNRDCKFIIKIWLSLLRKADIWGLFLCAWSIPGYTFLGCLFIKSWIWTGIFIKQKPQVIYSKILVVSCRDPSGARTQDPNIKSVVLYQLS